MASVVSTQPAPAAIRFSADFAANIPQYQRLIRRQPWMRWAKAFHLEADLEQLTLLELARFTTRNGELPASNEAHFRVVIASRTSDSARFLKRQHRDIAEDKNVSLDDDADDEGEGLGSRLLVDDTDIVVADAMRRQAVAALYAGIALLSPRQREVLEWVLLDLTDTEIAASLGVSVQAVNKTKLAAVSRLKQLVPAVHATV